MLTGITIYNLSVQIESTDRKITETLKRFIKRFYTIVEPPPKEGEPSPITVYAGYLKGMDTYFLTYEQFKHFRYYTTQLGIDLSEAKIVDARDYKSKDEDYIITEGWALRDKQPDIFDFIMERRKGSILIPVNMGVGKTFVSLYTMSKIGKRFGLLVLPKYIEKWIDDFKESHVSTDDEIRVIQGKDMLKDFIQRSKDNDLPWKYYVFSITTLRNFITAFEEDYETCILEYGGDPVSLFSDAGIHSLLIDETHEHFHSVFKILLYANIKLRIGMSATLIATSDKEMAAHNAIYPRDGVFYDKMIKKYIDFYPTIFNIDRNFLKKIRFKVRGGPMKGAYSQNEFENSIMKNKAMLNSYFRMVDEMVEDLYLEHYMEGDRVIIFVSRIKMATIFAKRFQEKYKDKVVKRYVEDDDYQDMLEGDIIVSTVLSLGTSITVPNLRVIVQTVNTRSAKSNLQTAGRLRYLPDRDVKFCWLFAGNIQKHIEYTEERIKIFESRTRKLIPLRSRSGFTPIGK